MIINKHNIDIEYFINAKVITKGKNKKFNKKRYLAKVLSEVKIEGEILEFGVWQGHSISNLAKYFKHQVVYGFDSFEGLLEDWFMTTEERATCTSKHPKGHFGQESLKDNIPTNVSLVKGFLTKVYQAG